MRQTRGIGTQSEASALGAGYPVYSRGEEWADHCLHLLGIALGIAGAVAIVALGASRGEPRLVIAVAIYAAGLLAMLICSALYNLAAPSARKERLRRLDHAAIFVMIAGTYTPFLLARMGGAWGWGMLGFVWVAAAVGGALALLAARRFERLELAAYLLLGWCILAARQPLAAALSGPALKLLLLGGLLYSFGVPFHLWRRLPYHNAIWHGFVLAAAACHYAAILIGVVLPAAPL
jgi:hemolysin III